MSEFNEWAIVELMGHSRIAGKVSEQVIAGSAMLRVDVPKVDTRPGHTKFYAPNAVYCITPVEEYVARAAARKFAVQPVMPWILSNLTSPALVGKVDERDEDDLSPSDYEDFDSSMYPEDDF